MSLAIKGKGRSQVAGGVESRRRVCVLRYCSLRCCILRSGVVRSARYGRVRGTAAYGVRNAPRSETHHGRGDRDSVTSRWVTVWVETVVRAATERDATSFSCIRPRKYSFTTNVQTFANAPLNSVEETAIFHPEALFIAKRCPSTDPNRMDMSGGLALGDASLIAHLSLKIANRCGGRTRIAVYACHWYVFRMNIPFTQ